MLPYPPPGDFSDPGFEPMSLTSPALAGGFFTTSATWEAPYTFLHILELLKTGEFNDIIFCVPNERKITVIQYGQMLESLSQFSYEIKNLAV